MDNHLKLIANNIEMIIGDYTGHFQDFVLHHIETGHLEKSKHITNITPNPIIQIASFQLTSKSIQMIRSLLCTAGPAAQKIRQLVNPTHRSHV